MADHLTYGVQPDPIIARLISECAILTEFLDSDDFDALELEIEAERRAASRLVEVL